MKIPNYKAARLKANKIYQKKDLIARLQLLEEQQHHELLDSQLDEIERIKAELEEIEELERLRDFVLEVRFGNPVAKLIQLGIGLGIGWFLIRVLPDTQLLLSHVPIVATGLIILAVGIILYNFRQRSRIIYGVVEVFVGIKTALKGIDIDFSTDLRGGVAYLQFLGGLYIVIRGFDNLTKGLDSNDEPSLWQAFMNKVKELRDFGHRNSDDGTKDTA